jgi:hypothetical protein
MSEVERRAILEAVARGNLSPDEAAVRLRAALHDLRAPAAHQGGQADPPGQAGGPATRQVSGSGGTGGPGDLAGPASEQAGRREPGAPTATIERRIRIEANAGSVRVVGDPTVAVVDVDGDNEVQEEGDTVVVRCSPLRDLDLDLDLDPHRLRHGHSGFAIRSRRMRVHDLRRHLQVTVRVNPSLPLDVQLAAGAVSVRGVHAPITCDVDAGAARLHDVSRSLRAKVNAGSLSVDGRVDGDEWHLTCDMGAASVRLDPASSTRVRAAVTLGKCDIRLPDADRRGDELVLGDGHGLLVVDGSMSAITIATA